MFQKIETLEEARVRNVEDALREDVGTGSLTELFVDNEILEAKIISRNNAILCGADWCIGCFKRINAGVKINFLKVDGDSINENETICSIVGDARGILEAERSALNFLQLLSSTATITKKYVQALNEVMIENSFCAVLDTRKTQPGLRLAQKYAVRIGGGKNQRFGLWDSLLFKENHLKCLGGINGLSRKLDDFHRANGKELIVTGDIQVEVENIGELKLALSMGIKNILLDNFTHDLINEAVSLNDKQAVLEVSGGVDLNSIVTIAKSGVDRISVGRLTKDVNAVDFSLQIKK
jgi:nicotinate-nucleotide pyrophosphorylase (carboxylating)